MAMYVNGEKVDEKQVEAEMERLRPAYEQAFAAQSEEAREGQLREWSQENVIEGILLRQAARREVTEASAEEVQKRFEELVEQHGGQDKLWEALGSTVSGEAELREEIAGQLRVETLLARVREGVARPSEKELRRYYEAHIEQFTFPERVRASHIVRHPQPDQDAEQMKVEMEEVAAKLAAGEDFGELVEKHSDCPERGGDLGYFPRGQMVPSFEEVVFGMKKGQTSGVFATEFGWHIAKVTDRVAASPCPLDQAREVVERQWRAEKEQRALEQYVDAEKAKATIEERDE